VIEDIVQKTLKFFSANEIPINRSLREDGMFSPVLRWLPAPATWLLAMGIAGLAWLAAGDARWPIVAAPIVIALFTVAVFFAEDRFRFHAMAVLALGSGIWIDSVSSALRGRRQGPVLIVAAIAGCVGTVSIAIGRSNPPAPIHWDHIVWGYINMGRIPDARALAERIAAEQPQNGPIWEALGFTAIARQEYSEAAGDYRRAIEIRPQSHIAHYNLAKVFLKLGKPVQAGAEARIALELYPSPDYQALVNLIRAQQ
jgi:tetratricopeptide (TPR) repeat protein